MRGARETSEQAEAGMRKRTEGWTKVVGMQRGETIMQSPGGRVDVC